MNKFSIGLFTLVLTILNSSYATEYPQLNKYEETARMLLSATQGAKSSNVNQLERKNTRTCCSRNGSHELVSK